jgi:hypothetical protein
MTLKKGQEGRAIPGAVAFMLQQDSLSALAPDKKGALHQVGYDEDTFGLLQKLTVVGVGLDLLDDRDCIIDKLLGR